MVNRYHPDDDISLEDVEQTLGIAVYRTLSNDYEGVSRSISTGKPIVLNGNSKYSRDMKALGAQVTGLRGKGDRASRCAPCPRRSEATGPRMPRAREE